MHRTAPTARTRLTPRRLLVLGAATALGPLSIDLYLPAFPELAAELGASEAAVQLTLTACVLGLALGQLVAGPLSDAVGRRAPIAVGLAAWSVASFACALAPSIATLTALRFTQGLAGAAGVVVARAVVRDLASGPELVKAFSKLMLVVGVVPIAAPTVGGLLLEHMSWRGIFVVLGGLGAFFTAVVLLWLEESLPASRRKAGVRRAVGAYRLLATDREFVTAALVVSLTFAALFVYVSSSSFVLREVYGLTPAQYGLLFGANSFGLVVGNQVAGLLANRVDPEVMLPRAIALGALAALSVLVAGLTGLFGVWGVVVPLFVLVASVGAAMPVASSRAMNAHPERAGAASALLGVLQFAVGGTLAPVVGLFGASSVLPLAVLMATCLVGSLTLHLLTARRRTTPLPALATA